MSLLKIENLNLSIKEDEKLIGANLEIDSGDVILLTGENGCGKSTLIKLIVDEPMTDYYYVNKDYQLLWKDSIDLREQKNKESFVRSICYVPQDDIFEAETILDCCFTTLAFTDKIENKTKYIFEFINKYGFEDLIPQGKRLSYWQKKKADKLLKQAELQNENNKGTYEKIASFLLTNPNRLSGGQKKMVDILCCLIRFQFSEMIILDEPLNALDYNHVRQLSNFLTKIHQENPTLAILCISHCRAILCVNKKLSISDNRIKEEPIEKHYGCFGNIHNDYYI